MDIAAFLSCFYAGAPAGQLSIWTRQDKLTSWFDVTTSLPAAALHARQRADSGSDVYFGVGLRRKAMGSGSRGTKADVLSLPALWLDVDIKGAGHKEANLPASLAEAAEVIDLCPLAPSVVVETGGGLHAYWLLVRPYEIQLGDAEKINAACKAWQKRIIDAAKTRWGYKIDSTANIDRVLRLPETWNYKDSPRRPVSVLLDDSHLRYRFEDVVASTKAIDAPKTITSSISAPDLRQEIKRRLRNLGNQENRDIMADVLAGKPFAPGERDTMLQKAASLVAFVLSPEQAAAVEAEDLAPLFDDTVKAMEAAALDPENPAPTREIVIDKLDRALNDRARTVENDREIRQWQRQLAGTPDAPTAETTAAAAGGAGDAGAAAPPAGGGDGGGGGGDPPKSPPDKDGSKSPSGRDLGPQYSAAEIADFCNRDKLTPDVLRKRWIIQHESSYYILGRNGYKKPVGRESFMTHAKDDLAPASEFGGVQIYTYTAKGDERQKTVPEVLKDYATGARVLKGSLVLERSRFDPDTETFWEAVCPPRKIEPKFHPQIDQWLRLLGGDQVDKLFYWISTVLRLDLQSSALYLSGVPSSGKTMFAHGLARLWTTSGPTLLENVADTNFNADIARCPLVLGDEAVKCSTSELRRLIGSSAHVLKRKFLANVDLEGCLRIVLADNSGKLLDQEDLSGSDLEAVASKFLHITVGPPPVDYLRSIGGRKGTDGWVDGDMIAEHALEIALNRPVTLGNRLAVEGGVDRMMQLLVVQDRVTGVLCQWIAKFIEKPLQGIVNDRLALVGNGKILVAAEGIERYWTSFVSERNHFSLTKIGRSLNNISEGKTVVHFKSGTVRRMHLIKAELIYAWAEENLSCDMNELKAKVNAAVTFK